MGRRRLFQAAMTYTDCYRIFNFNYWDYFYIDTAILFFFQFTIRSINAFLDHPATFIILKLIFSNPVLVLLELFICPIKAF